MNFRIKHIYKKKSNTLKIKKTDHWVNRLNSLAEKTMTSLII